MKGSLGEGLTVTNKHVSEFEVKPGEPEQNESEIQEEETGQQGGNLQDYLLARDRTRRAGSGKKPERYGHSSLVAYAFNVAEELGEEPRTYSEAVKSQNNDKWIVYYE